MKKIISVISIFLTIVAFTSLKQVSAQEETDSSPTPTPITYIQYDLPYPGILPDHPLYKLKVLRDKIISSSIINPQKKIDFLLLQADKGILATAMLIDKNKIDLAQETALKAENNVTLMTPQLYMLSKKPNKEFFKKLETASLKHQEVLKSIIKRLPEDKKKVFEQVIDFSKRNIKSVTEYQNQE